MSTTKSFRFAAPYRSSTFNSAQAQVFGTNGVITGGAVTTSGGVVTVQPLTFVQNGMFVTTDYSMSVSEPEDLVAPYSVAISVSSSVENTSETLTPVFVKRPLDVSTNTVVIADWDGTEWIARPKLQVKELIAEDQSRAIKQDLIGIAEGFDVSAEAASPVTLPDSSTTTPAIITVEPGTLVDRTGSLVTKIEETEFTSVIGPAADYDRVDTVVYRKPLDSSYRQGQLTYLVGDTFHSSGNIVPTQSATISATGLVTNALKIVRLGEYDSAVFYTSDYGSRTELKFATIDAFGEISEADPSVATVATDISGADVAYDEDNGFFEIVYTRGKSLYYQRRSSDGSEFYPETLVTSGLYKLVNPRVVSIGSSSSRFVHIVYEQVVSSSNHKLYYTRLSTANTVETSPVALVQLSSVITNPSLSSDDEDYLLFLAYENQTTGRVYLRTYDVSTVTASSAPVQIGTTVELQDDTFKLSPEEVMPVAGASNPIVVRTKTKDTFVFWLHDNGTEKSVSVYSSTYASLFGYKAVSHAFGIGASIEKFSVAVNDKNKAHFAIYADGSIHQVSIDLESDSTDYLSTDISGPTSACDSIVAHLSQLGTLLHTWGSNSGAYTNNANASGVLFFGPGTYLSEPIAGNEFVVAKTTGNPLSPGYADLDKDPTTGDVLVVSGATTSSNNQQFSWVSSREIVDGTDTYVVVGTDGLFTSESGAISTAAQFKYLTGDALNYTRTNTGAYDNMRGFDVTRTDIFVANIRTSDRKLSVSGTALEESTPVNRLYEYLNCMSGGGGMASWQIAGNDVLQFDADFEVRFFNRTATYTISAETAGVTIEDGQLAYVEIPDLDQDAALELKVGDFGSGVLDRYGKVSYPLFWNIAGVLYTRFAPFSLRAGETGVLGESGFITTGSSVYYTTGNVGIGTDSPAARLHVEASGIKEAVRITQTGSGDALVVEDEESTDSTPFVIKSDGKVGVGTTSPSVGVHIVGEQIIEASGSTSALRITQTGSGDALRVEDNSNLDTTPFVVKSDGAVGIGTDTPASKLDVYGADDSTLVTLGNLSGDTKFTATVTEDTGITFDSYESSSSRNYIFKQAGTEVVRIDTSGFVGIGTATPQAALDVTQTGMAGSAIIVPRDTTVNRPTTPVNGMLRYATDTNRFEMYQNSAWTNVTPSSGYAATVGSAAQVASGVATHTSIDTAIAGATAGDKILVLPNTYTESVTWSASDITLEGSGHTTILNGNLTLSGTGNQVLGIKVSGNLNLTGSNYNFVRAWISSTSVFTAGGTANSLNIIQE